MDFLQEKQFNVRLFNRMVLDNLYDWDNREAIVIGEEVEELLLNIVQFFVKHRLVKRAICTLVEDKVKVPLEKKFPFIDACFVNSMKYFESDV